MLQYVAMDEVTRIREKIDIVALLSEYIPLKKMGRNFKINCPFHNEKSPSFVVSPERQIWHCFGCGKGGDIYTFLMEYEKLEFVEALRILAKKAGIELEESDFVKQGASKKEKFTELMLSQRVLSLCFDKTSAEKYIETTLQKKKNESKIIETFEIGYSPISGDALTNIS